MRVVAIILGVLAFLVGAVWTLQGLNILKGSFMSGSPMWLIIGVILVVVGLAVLGFGTLTGRKQTPAA